MSNSHPHFVKVNGYTAHMDSTLLEMTSWDPRPVSP